MLYRSFVTAVLVTLLSPTLSAQRPSTSPPNGKITASRAKTITGRLADTVTTSAAGVLVDSLLGNRAVHLAGLIEEGQPRTPPSCPAGLVPYAAPAATSTALASPTVPSAGSFLIGAAKKRLGGKKSNSSVPTSVSGQQFQCGTPEQATAGMQAAQAQAVPGQIGKQPQSVAAAMLAKTPQGMLVNGAIAAAPMAGQAAKKLGGILGRGKQTRETMIKDLARGKLQVKGITFVNGSDELVAGSEKEITALVEALKASEGRFLLNVPAEADVDTSPDKLMALRRITKLAGLVQAAGISDGRLTVTGVHPAGLDPKSAAPKPGDARAEILRIPM